MYWAIGDVHGAIFSLEKLVKKLPKDAKLVFVGDLIDRGRYSKEVVEFVRQSQSLCVMGNHESFMIKFGKQSLDKPTIWTQEPIYGGEATVASYKGDEKLFLEHIDFFRGLPYYLEIEGRYITHGFGLPYYRRRKSHGVFLLENSLEDISFDWEEWWKYEVFNIFGHTPYEEVLFGPNYAGIDTGCIFGGKLSALSLDSLEVISVELDSRDI